MAIINLRGNQLVKKEDGSVYVKGVAAQPGMLLVWATWCPHCTSFQPTFKDIAASLGDDFTCAAVEESQLRHVDSTIQSALMSNGFPSIKFFDQKGKIIGTYDAPSRDKRSVMSYICKVYHHCVQYH